MKLEDRRTIVNFYRSQTQNFMDNILAGVQSKDPHMLPFEAKKLAFEAAQKLLMESRQIILIIGSDEERNFLINHIDKNFKEDLMEINRNESSNSDKPADSAGDKEDLSTKDSPAKG